MSQIIEYKDKPKGKDSPKEMIDNDTEMKMECLYYSTSCGNQASGYCTTYGIAVCCEHCQDQYHQLQEMREEEGDKGTSPSIKQFVNLWYLHVALTRQFILFNMREFGHDYDEKSASITEKTTELMKNQEDIGNMIGKLLKDVKFGDAVTQLLKEHISIAAEMVQAYLDDKSINVIQGIRTQDIYQPNIEFIRPDLALKWTQNAQKISDALKQRLQSKNVYGNPNYIDVQESMSFHLKYTNIEMVHEITDNRTESLVVFEELVYHIQEFSRKLFNLLK